MKRLLAFMLVVVVMITLGLAGCKKQAKSGELAGEHPSKAGEGPSKAQTKSEHPTTEHPK